MMKMIRTTGIMVIMASVTACAIAQKPEIKSASVFGFPVGATTTLVLYGENLTPKSIMVTAPLAVRLIDAKPTDEKNKGKGARQVTIEVVVPTNCARNSFELQLIGQDNSVTKTPLFVTEATAVEVPIKKPSSTFATAMLVPGPSAAVVGQLDVGAADVVRFEAKSGEVWDIYVLASRAGSLLDAVLRVRNSRHVSLALSAGDKKKDRRISFHVPADGAYFVELTDAEAKGGTGYQYRMMIMRR